MIFPLALEGGYYDPALRRSLSIQGEAVNGNDRQRKSGQVQKIIAMK
jgi:hypothetical protein